MFLAAQDNFPESAAIWKVLGQLLDLLFVVSFLDL